MLKCFLKDERGATATEYALLAGMLALFAVAAVQAVHVEVEQSFDNVGTAIASGNTSVP